MSCVPAGASRDVQIGVAGTGAADLHQDLPWPWFWHRHVAQLSGLLPFDEPESLDGLSP